jgi:hypothetical protein
LSNFLFKNSLLEYISIFQYTAAVAAAAAAAATEIAENVLHTT